MRRDRPPLVTVADVRAALWSLVSTAVGLGIAIAVVDGADATGPWAVVPAALVVGVGDALLRPALRRLARAGGALGALLLGLAAQVAVVWAALTFLPGVSSDSWTAVLGVLLVAAVVMACGHWVLGARDNAYVVGDLLRRSRRRAGLPRRAGPEAAGAGDGGDERPPGVLVVMLDGVARPTLEHALQAGLAPTLERWLASGSHHLESWWARVPCTTPASTLGLLHGTTAAVPAFRWWSRRLGRLVVTNRPADAAEVERTASDGRGLLAHGGVAVSTMFSGDAPTTLLVMSRAAQGLGPGQLFVRFFSSPFVLVRAVLGTVAEALKELYQGWQQVVRGVRPRVRRGGWYPVLRAVTNVLLRDLNTSLVAEQLVRGAPVVCVDLVDYDEIAHHAGPLRPEALRALEGLDRVVGLWEEIARGAPRRYRVVVVSDHGQSLGATFEQVVGRSFGDEVHRLMALPAPEHDDRAEREVWGPANTALNALRKERDGAGRLLVGPDRDDPGPGLPEVEVIGSGNLGMIWFCRSPRRLAAAEVEARWPALVPGLVGSPAVGFVVVHGAEGPVARGRRGSHDLATGRVTGRDPLAGYGSRARADLLRVAGLEDAGDLVVVSAVGPMGRVHALEGLVGSHGGLGGAQGEAFLLHPADLRVPDDEREDVDGARMLVGAETVHRRLVAWLASLGLREDA
ncbi:alkaline phosphatase family protein [Isoptericola sp. 4D.3]|uniref:Alkaline phosphatase family protein n=1 Tax=Isoptericola peretonis TaxID=2918523 RepID=A0ABT0J7V5_9MICO|nr:alkaline phosphatase family protein [Isoptericola sp. 4D.3]